MPYELWSAAASVGTFIVVTATAIAALIQLRHMRTHNELSAVLGLFAQKETDSMQRHFDFVRNDLATKMEDPNFRAGLTRVPVDRAVHHEMFVGDFYDQLGHLIMVGLVSEEVILLEESYRIIAFWDLLAPAIAIMRRDGNDLYQGFEFLMTRARIFVDNLQKDPVLKFDRVKVQDTWLTTDRQSSDARPAP